MGTRAQRSTDSQPPPAPVQPGPLGDSPSFGVCTKTKRFTSGLCSNRPRRLARGAGFWREQKQKKPNPPLCFFSQVAKRPWANGARQAEAPPGWGLVPPRRSRPNPKPPRERFCSSRGVQLNFRRVRLARGDGSVGSHTWPPSVLVRLRPAPLGSGEAVWLSFPDRALPFSRVPLSACSPPSRLPMLGGTRTWAGGAGGARLAACFVLVGRCLSVCSWC